MPYIDNADKEIRRCISIRPDRSRILIYAAYIFIFCLIRRGINSSTSYSLRALNGNEQLLLLGSFDTKL